MRKQLIFGPVRNVSDSGSVRLPGIKGLACSEEKYYSSREPREEEIAL